MVCASNAAAEPWSFAVFSDHINQQEAYHTVLGEIRRLRGRGESGGQQAPPLEFALACGDLSPVSKAFRALREVLGPNPPDYFPVRGNHEKVRDVSVIKTSILPRYGDRIVRYGDLGVSYYVDVKNVRLIVLDQYEDFGIYLNRLGALKWLGNALKTGPGIEHVFVAYHQPSIPVWPAYDSFWTLLGKHRDKVRAVFFGHTHVYSRRVIDTASGGIQAVNTGCAGQKSHNDGHWTVVRVTVDGPKVLFETFRTPMDADRFEREDVWDVSGK